MLRAMAARSGQQRITEKYFQCGRSNGVQAAFEFGSTRSLNESSVGIAVGMRHLSIAKTSAVSVGCNSFAVPLGGMTCHSPPTIFC
jgi:hypothetical protein